MLANSIQGVRAGAYPDKTRVVIDLSDKPSYQFETLTNPDRLVVDLSQTSLATALPVSVAKSNLLSQVRKSTPAKSGDYRLVFDLTRPASVKAFTLAPSGQYKYRLVVDLTPKGGGTTVQADAPAAKTAIATKPSAKPATVTKTSTTSVASRSSQPIVVAIDAGHGGKDPGSIGPGRNQEKKITLAIAKKVAANINATPGMRAVLTRSSDRYVSLDERSRIARRNKALLLISIHADSFTSSGPRGASVFVLNTRRANTEIGRWVVKKEEQSELLGGGG
ncbi:MAG: N-acetylmuramoyl-L-alanine amidase, partial [Vibrio sp.]